jgi:flagellar basal-body rod protein FlgB
LSRDLFTDTTSLVLAKCLDAAAVRHKVIANNIANVETPGYKRSEVLFEDHLKQVLEGADRRLVKRRVRELEPVVTTDTLSPSRPDGNNVSIDREMADLAKNSLRYEAAVQILNLKNAMIRTVLTEGRR